MIRINIGCGNEPTEGWRNLDNSLSLRLAKIPVLPEVLYRTGIIDRSQFEFIRFARGNKIEYGDATRRLPVPDGSCDAVYSSHMIEHLDRNEVGAFLDEVFRVLQPGGVIRIATPDLKRQAEKYLESGDADAFIEATHLCVDRPISLKQRLRLLLLGTRHHQWEYDGDSLIRLLQKHGFARAEVMPGGKTKIRDYQPLNLYVYPPGSVYVEAERPGA